MASCMECIHFNPCNSHGKIIVEKPTESNDWGLHNKVENECKYFTPTADFVEVKHGEWIDDIQEFYSPAGVRRKYLCGYKCSLCGRTARIKEPYCNCGAKMDGERSDT